MSYIGDVGRQEGGERREKEVITRNVENTVRNIHVENIILME